MTGQTISHYRILAKLGEGGMGVVYEAEDTKLNRKVALKFLPHELLANPGARERFLREAQAAAALDHPNICTVYEIDEAGGRTFLAMALIKGENLADKVRQRPLPLDEALDIAIQMAEGLHAAHDSGIVHRDIKCANAMLTPRGQVKLMDFGLAQLNGRTRITQAGARVGTPAYMSPEQVRGEETDRRTDIWSLGVVLYEMVSGRLPFAGEVEEAMAHSVIYQSPEPLTALRTGVPRELDRIVSKALAKSAAERYQHIDELLVDLRSVRKSPSPAASSAPVRAESARKPWVAMAAGLTGLVVLSAAAFYWYESREAAPPAALAIKPLTSFEGTEWMPSWSPDGSLFVYAHASRGGADLYVMPARGGDPLRLTEHPADDLMPRWSPDGRYIAFQSDRGAGADIYLISPLGPLGSERKLTSTNLYRDLVFTNGLGAQPWSPDGKELLFPRLQKEGGVALWKINVASKEESQLTFPTANGWDMDASWSFDGKQIVFGGRRQGKPGIWVMPATSGEPRHLIASGTNPSWTTGNRRIVFSSPRGGAVNLIELSEMDVESGKTRQLTTGLGLARWPLVAATGSLAYAHFTHTLDLHQRHMETGREERISFHSGVNINARIAPDGKRIAYTSNRTGNEEIWLLDLATKTERQLTDDPAPDSHPDWSPDGREIVFRSARDGQSRLWILNADGGPPRRVSEASAWSPLYLRTLFYNVAPRWSPDGRAIGYLDPAEGGVALWTLDPKTKAARERLPGPVIGFDWYRDSDHVIYTRQAADGSATRELCFRNLNNGQESVLLRGPFEEVSASADGAGITYGDATSHFNQQLFVLRLAPPASEGAAPRVLGAAKQLTDGRGLWHIHNGGWSRDGKSIVYTRDVDQADILSIENYR